MKNNVSLTDAIEYRRSVRIYHETKEIDSETVKNCIQQATLAPSSSNMQLWEFHHITSQKVIDKIAVACLNQSAAKTAKQMVIVMVLEIIGVCQV